MPVFSSLKYNYCTELDPARSTYLMAYKFGFTTTPSKISIFLSKSFCHRMHTFRTMCLTWIRYFPSIWIKIWILRWGGGGGVINPCDLRQWSYYCKSLAPVFFTNITNALSYSKLCKTIELNYIICIAICTISWFGLPYYTCTPSP